MLQLMTVGDGTIREVLGDARRMFRVAPGEPLVGERVGRVLPRFRELKAEEFPVGVSSSRAVSHVDKKKGFFFQTKCTQDRSVGGLSWCGAARFPCSAGILVRTDIDLDGEDTGGSIDCGGCDDGGGNSSSSSNGAGRVCDDDVANSSGNGCSNNGGCDISGDGSSNDNSNGNFQFFGEH